MVAGMLTSTTREDAGRAQLRIRRHVAFSVGETHARRRAISADAYLFLYKELVMLAGERAFCWPGLDYLSSTLETSAGTLKRWMKELERADLIRRRSRPGGQTSLTYITVYLEPDSCINDDRLANNADQVIELRAHGSGHAAVDEPAQAEQPASSSRHDAQIGAPPVFFGAPEEIILDRSVGSEVISHTVKDQTIKNLNGSGGGDDSLTEPRPEYTAIRQVLDAEAVLDPGALIELQQKRIDELSALSQYLDKQRNIRCRPGLFVWLARQEFGAQLLAGRHRREHRNVHPREVVERAVVDPPQTKLHAVWQDVLGRLNHEVPADDWMTWLAPTTLLELHANDVVVGTPNVFVRQEIETRFLNTLAEALQHVLGASVRVHLVIEQAALLA